jgi:hypothetical protein
LTGGEGWHNNHHHYQSSARQGFFWWEIDVTYYLLRLLRVFGIVRDLREPPPRARDRRPPVAPPRDETETASRWPSSPTLTVRPRRGPGTPGSRVPRA